MKDYSTPTLVSLGNAQDVILAWSYEGGPPCAFPEDFAANIYWEAPPW